MKHIAQISDYIWPHLTSSFSLGMSHNANRRWTLLVKPHTSHLLHCHSHSKLRTQGLKPFDSHTVHFSAILLQRSAPILESAKQIFARFALTPSENMLLICRVLLLDDKNHWNSWVCWVPYEVGAVLTSSKRSWTKRPCLHVFSSAFLSVGFPACILSLVW